MHVSSFSFSHDRKPKRAGLPPLHAADSDLCFDEHSMNRAGVHCNNSTGRPDVAEHVSN
ncbi:hypothetical protein CSIRO_1061 [Bradyrhizobiaceae bacterium SG-6C]|nr:hypothetical protein CSIRO_1061 [Bradyrhizobiaceae bacterium SG-6C]